MMRSFVKRMIEWKFYIGRASSYLAMLNTGMILLLFLAKLKDYGYDFRIATWGLPIYVATVLLFIVIGYIDVKLGLARYENTISQKANAELHQIKNDVAEIKEALRREA